MRAAFVIVSLAACGSPAPAATSGDTRIDALEHRVAALERAAAGARTDEPSVGHVAAIAAVEPSSATRTLHVAIARDAIDVDGKQVSRAELGATLRTIAASGSSRPVMVESRDDIDYSIVAGVIDELRDAGFTNFAFAIAKRDVISHDAKATAK